ncbi:MAG TPA: hypothetical protein VKA36_10140 [Solirubrobacterales bacterium]|nr:hypothetical protein [Solirubrobacterales bacterium]
MTLAEKLLAIHHALERAEFEHAFGGAIALAYWTLDPRGTSDIDVNIFVPAARAGGAVGALPDGVACGEADLAAIERDGQARLWWDETPVDVFFDYERLHEEASRHRRLVPFAGEEIPILGPVELATFKAVFDRTRDWADIEAMLAAETLDLDAVRAHLAKLTGADDARLRRLAEAAERVDAARARATGGGA